MNQILIAYVPVLHRGYQEFFAKYAGADLYLLDRAELIGFAELEYLKKDIRVLDVALAVKAVKSWQILKSVKAIKNQELEQLSYSLSSDQKSTETELILTSDDIGHFIAEHFFASHKQTSFEPIFLRWDKNLMSLPQDIPDGVAISKTALEQQIMGQAFAESGKSSDWWRHVGSVIARDGQVLLAGYNQHLPSPDQQYKNSDPRIPFTSGVGGEFSSSIHAEAGLIALAAKRGLALEGAEMFVTTFPCPVCAKSIATAGIKKLYYAKGYAVLDGLEVLRSAGVEVVLVKFTKEELAEMEKMENARSRVKESYEV